MFSNTCAMTLAQRSDRILAQTRGLSGATPNATQLIEELRWVLEENRKENATLTAERDEARRMYCKEVEHHHDTTWNDGERDFKPLSALDVAISKGWDCYKKSYCFRVNGVVVSKGKAVPPKFELGEDDK